MLKSAIGIKARFDDSDPLPCHVYPTKLCLMILRIVMNISCKFKEVDFYENALLGSNGSWEL